MRGVREFLDLLNIESVLFKDEIKISEKSYDLKDLYQKPKVSLVVDNVTKLISEGQSKSINDVMYNHIWIDNHIRGGESPNLEFKPRVFFTG